MTNRKTAAPKVKTPRGFHTITPFLSVTNARAALEFYRKAFGATVVELHAERDGKISNVIVQVGDSPIMISDDSSQHAREHSRQGWPRSPKRLRGTSASLYFYVAKADLVFRRAIAAGATIIEPPQDKEWGDRVGALRDPFGHIWNIASHIRPMAH